MFGKFSFFPEAASRHASQIDMLFFALIAMSLFFIVLITFLIVYFSVKYRRREGNEVAIHTHESHWLEIAWSIIPFALSIGLFVWGVQIFFQLHSPAPANSLEIFAVGKQWMWKFQHPEGRREINNLHIPIGRPIKMSMISQDVIHSFYVPAFRIKHDVLPMKYTETWFEAIKPGVYHLFCAEYCGTEHSRMGGTVIAMEPADYQAWLASPLVEGGNSREGVATTATDGGGAMTDADRGKALLEAQGCRACHRTDGSAIAPMLEGIYQTKQPLTTGASVTADDNYLRESILVPTAKVVKGYMPVMPPYLGRISEDEIKQIISYIKSTSGSKK